MNMSEMHFELKGREAIKSVGFKYMEADKMCRCHKLNNLKVAIDLRHMPQYSLLAIESDLDSAFLDLLKQQIKDAGMQKVHKIVWDRIFVVGPNWNVRECQARFWVEIWGEDSPNNHLKKPHVQRA